ncbi:MAG TPA: efflux RND transporter periplasmic adaptor subunit, partial [Candidatus Eisenbacteria bacterium]|nr:efflux RND transporter periplasmic adaptor subunit [Candidatus Eisenbacteria bacterium]
VEPVSTRGVEYAVNAVGSVEAYEIVQVTARVPGAVEKVHFREGDRVGKDDVLVEIEPDRYRLNVEEARAAVEKAKAALSEAEAGLARRAGVNEKTAGLIPAEEVDAWRTRVSSAKADVAAREAALSLANRNARDAQARAPFAGTIQTRDVQTGRYVQPGTLLTTLVRRDPLLLRFQVPEGDAAPLRRGMMVRFRVRNVPGERTARLVLVAGSADATSRMVAVTAEVNRPDAALRPGAFAEVTVPIGSMKHAPVIPQTAVRPGERGFLAYVVSKGLAHERVLTLGLRTADGQIEVKSGLAGAESLVVRGAEALSEGARVRIVKAGTLDTGPATPATKDAK